MNLTTFSLPKKHVLFFKSKHICINVQVYFSQPYSQRLLSISQVM